MEVAVTGGQYKGKKIQLQGTGKQLRPTLAKIREAVFDILGQDLSDCTFVDGFAGSGIIGIEALSRQAQKVLFIEQNARHSSILKKNLKSYPDHQYCIIQSNLFTQEKLLQQGDLFYFDPPFQMKLEAQILTFIYKQLPSEKVYILESNHKLDLSAYPFELLRKKKYGGIFLTFLTHHNT